MKSSHRMLLWYKHLHSADMLKFHSHVMRQNFISLFSRMVNVKPAYLREMYHELTGDSFAASSEIESHVNERVR